MDFLIQWLCYLAAFVAGSVVAGAIASIAVTRRSRVSVPADAPGLVEREVEGEREDDVKREFAVKGEGEGEGEG